MKRNLEFRKKIFFKKHLLTNVQQNILPRGMEWLRDATNPLEKEDSVLNKGINKGVFLLFFFIQASFSYDCN